MTVADLIEALTDLDKLDAVVVVTGTKSGFSFTVDVVDYDEGLVQIFIEDDSGSDDE